MVYIKLEYNKKCKKVLLPKESMSFEELQELLKNSFGLVEKDKIHLTYKDITDHNEEITVDTQEDLEVAFQSLIKQQIIKFFVFYSGNIKSIPNSLIQSKKLLEKKQIQPKQNLRKCQSQLPEKNQNQNSIKQQQSFFQQSDLTSTGNQYQMKKYSLVLSEEDGSQTQDKGSDDLQNSDIKYVDKLELQQMFAKANDIFQEINKSVKEMVKQNESLNKKDTIKYEMELNVKKVADMVSQRLLEGIDQSLKEVQSNKTVNKTEKSHKINIKNMSDIDESTSVYINQNSQINLEQNKNSNEDSNGEEICLFSKSTTLLQQSMMRLGISNSKNKQQQQKIKEQKTTAISEIEEIEQFINSTQDQNDTQKAVQKQDQNNFKFTVNKVNQEPKKKDSNIISEQNDQEQQDEIVEVKIQSLNKLQHKKSESDDTQDCENDIDNIDFDKNSHNSSSYEYEQQQQKREEGEEFKDSLSPPTLKLTKTLSRSSQSLNQ